MQVTNYYRKHTIKRPNVQWSIFMGYSMNLRKVFKFSIDLVLHECSPVVIRLIIHTLVLGSESETKYTEHSVA